MKKLITLLLITLGTLAYGQTSQGWLYVGGGGMVGVLKQTQTSGGSPFTENLFRYHVIPTVGYFIMDGVLVGGNLHLESEKFKSQTTADFSLDRSISFGPLVRYYHHSDYFVQADLALGKRKFESESGGFSSVTTQNIFGFNLGVGKAIFLNEFVSIEPMLLYGSKKYTNVDFDISTRDHGFFGQIFLSIYID